MRRYIYTILTILFAGLAITACSDQDYDQLDKGKNQLALTADQPMSVLDETNHASDAITLNWTTGNNYGTGNRISYRLELAKAGTDFANPYVCVDEQTQTYVWSANVENLNNIILDKMGGTVGEPIDIEARVTAIVSGSDEVQTATASFSATPYEPVTSTLYIIGSAAPNGWSADNASEMTRTDNGLFTWEGTLAAGELKFITTLGQFLPSYNRGDNGEPVLRTSDDQPDNKWNIDETHDYKVTVDLLGGTVAFEKTDGVKPLFDQLFFVGNATGWGFEAMTRDAIDPFLFRMGRVFEQGNGGEFKFGTADGSWENMYKATQANAPYTDQSMEFVAGYDPDNKWFLQDSETGKAYKICVDIRSGKERMMMSEFTPYDMIYLVGDATPNGWDLGNATPMTTTESPYVFTWTGQLNAGELKFSCDKQSDWAGAWFMATSADAEPKGTAEPTLFINKSDESLKAQYLTVNVGDLDYKWKITSSGTYTITLDQLHETVTITKD